QPNRAASSGRPIRIDRKCGDSYHHVSQSAATYRAYRLAVRECETINRTENCMKAQHRRELHTNLLADRMGRLVRNVQSAPKSTSIILWSFVVLAAGTFIIWEYAARSSQGSRSALWARVDIALHNPQEGTGQLDNAAKQLDNVAKENPGT